MTERQLTEEPEFVDPFFRRKDKKGGWRIIDCPHLEASVADTHAHLHMLKNPALSLARAGANTVEFVCSVFDIFEDGTKPLDEMEGWRLEGSFMVRRLARGGC